MASNSEGWVPRWHSRATRARWVPLEGSCSLTEFSLRLLPSAVGGFTLFFVLSRAEVLHRKSL